MPIYFVSGKILLEAAQLQTDAFHCLYISTIPVHHMCAHNVYHLCVMCSLAVMHTSKLHATCTVSVYLSFTHVYRHACVKFKLSFTIMLYKAVILVRN